MESKRMICIEGLDGSGKNVQTKLLRDYLAGKGCNTLLLDFPRYDGFFGKEIGAMLSGGDAGKLDVKSTCLWFAADRRDAFRDINIDAYDFVILNRYTLSNVAYQCARAGERLDHELADWILELEHGRFELPEPDLYIYLDVPVDVSRTNNSGKGFRRYVGVGSDVYEKSVTLQQRARSVYLELAETRRNLRVLGCMSEEGELYPIQDVHRRILRLLRSEGFLV